MYHEKKGKPKILHCENKNCSTIVLRKVLLIIFVCLNPEKFAELTSFIVVRELFCAALMFLTL